MNLAGIRCCLLLTVASVLPVSGWCADFEKVRQEIERALETEQVPSLAVAVARDGKILWEAGFGWADREQRRPATEHTVYSLASITKPITATAAMLLVEKGELDWDTPANEYLRTPLTAHVGEAGAATLRRLASHSAGLPLHYHFFYEDESHTRPPFDESVRRYGHLMWPPGEHFQYANFGYGVLDHLIEQQSGMSYEEFVRRHVFLPLGMLRSSVHLASELEGEAAVRYAQDQTPLPNYDFDHAGASAVYSSAHDLLRFGMFHLQTPLEDQAAILPAHRIQAMQEPAADTSDGRHYGLGWFIDPDEHGLRTVSHSGGMGGVRTRLTLVPEEKIAVVALCNQSSDLPLRITREILAELLPEYGVRMRKAEPHRPNPQPPKPGCPSWLVGYWAGEIDTYAGRRRLELWAHPHGDIYVRLAGQLRTLLNGSQLRGGLLTGVMAGDIATPDANRRPYHLHLALSRRESRLEGPASAISLPDRKPGNALSYWTSLTKMDDDPQVLALFNGHDLGGWRVADEFDFARHGLVRVADGMLVLGKGNPATGVVWQGDPYRYDYELSLEAKRLAGSDFFCGITFPVGDEYLSLIIGGWGGGVTGISNLDGMSAVENETTGYAEFQNDRWYRVRLRVTRDHISAWVDDDSIIDLELRDRKLSIWWEQEPMRPLGIASWHTKAALRNIHLKRLPASPPSEAAEVSSP